MLGPCPGSKLANPGLPKQSTQPKTPGGEANLAAMTQAAQKAGAKVLLVEDVVTTGLSSREAIAAIAAEGGARLDRIRRLSRWMRGLLIAAAVLLSWIVLFAAWFLLGIPWGPDAPVGARVRVEGADGALLRVSPLPPPES